MASSAAGAGKFMANSDPTKVLAVIPARHASSRFPGKPLTPIAGKPMIQHVVERVRRAALVSRVVVATEDARIKSAVEAFGGEAIITRTDHRTGTDRVAEVAVHILAEIYVNVQGDEPLIDPNVVKVVRDFDGNALYFSRAPVPWVRDTAETVAARHWKHLGLYGFRRDALLEFPTLPPGELERLEQLEQLRWLENGFHIRVVETDYDAVSVDVPSDVARVEKLLGERREA